MNCLRLTFLILLLLPVKLVAAQDDPNPPMDGFDMEGSDPIAVQIADEVMSALGGRKAWDNTRYLSWSFFGEDQLWDKWTGRFRWQNDSMVVLMNIHDMTGTAYLHDEEVSSSDAILEGAYRDWINSGYWLMMPYKLKDSGVTLGYAGEGSMENGRASHILTLTFDNVGLTPDNRYVVHVDQETMLVGQWSFYRDAADDEPGFTLPWENWRQYGDIMLSDQRGVRQDGSPFELPNVGVYEDLPDALFEDPARTDLSVLSADQ